MESTKENGSMQKVSVKYARAKIKDHIRKRGEEYCIDISKEMVVFWFRYLNAAIFNNKLEMPQSITVFQPRYGEDAALGYCRYIKKDSYHMGICSEFDDRKTFLTVLVHEMVHLWQLQKRTSYPFIKRMTHGKSFYEWEDKIKRTIGLPLNEYIDVW